jgi:hypothetical protein
MTDQHDPRGAIVADPTEPEAGANRRERFRTAVSRLAERSSSADLIRWMLVPGSLAVLLGFAAMVLGWVGAARTAREIEQIPYLISGGLIGLALVVLGALLLASTFWVAVLRKLQREAELRAEEAVADLSTRVTALEDAPRTARSSRTPARRTRAS